MFKTATAAILSVTLTLGALAPAPAHADPRAQQRGEIAGLLIGAAALAFILKELNDDKDRAKSREKSRARKPVIEGNLVGRHAPPRGGVITPHRPDRARSVPASCRRVVATGNGNRRLFGVPCLRRAGVQVARLPQTCLRTVRLPRRTVDAFQQGCLRREGVRIVD